MATQINKSQIFSQMWVLVKGNGMSRSEALKQAWAEAKAPKAPKATTYSVQVTSQTLGVLTIEGKIGVGEYAKIFNAKGEEIGFISAGSGIRGEYADEHKIGVFIKKQRGALIIPAKTLEIMEGSPRVKKEAPKGTGRFTKEGYEIMWTENFWHKASDSYATRTQYRKQDGTLFTKVSASH